MDHTFEHAGIKISPNFGVKKSAQVFPQVSIRCMSEYQSLSLSTSTGVDVYLLSLKFTELIGKHSRNKLRDCIY